MTLAGFESFVKCAISREVRGVPGGECAGVTGPRDTVMAGGVFGI